MFLFALEIRKAKRKERSSKDEEKRRTRGRKGRQEGRERKRGRLKERRAREIVEWVQSGHWAQSRQQIIPRIYLIREP